MTQKQNPLRDPKAVRIQAAALSSASGSAPSISNEDRKPPYIFNFTKGLSHGLNGLLVDPVEFEDFADGTEDHDPATFEKADPFREQFLTVLANGDPNCPKDGKYRQWESPTAGHAYVLEGPDPQAIPMPPAPPAGSAELAAEIAEVYQMALSRDWPVASFMDDTLIKGLKDAVTGKKPASQSVITGHKTKVDGAAHNLTGMRWFKGEQNKLDLADDEQKGRRRFGTPQSASNMFRGLGEDLWATPFLSQFMVMGSGGCHRTFEDRRTGIISYGAQTIDQRCRVAVPHRDYMMTWPEYIDVQNGANIRARADLPPEFVRGIRRHMSTLRDLATYVHDDQLYQAYLNAALIMLAERFDLDPGIPFHDASAMARFRSNREPFALFGGPHLLTLVTEVSSRALKAVRYQKFSVHRRMRPEAAGGLMHAILTFYTPHREQGGKQWAIGDGSAESVARKQLGSTMAHYLDEPGAGTVGDEPALTQILSQVASHIAEMNGENISKNSGLTKWLLPMAFPEGSPMHPAYGAGHATVAGACVTLLKAFFAMTDHHGAPVYLVEPNGKALVPGAPVNDPKSETDMLAVEIKEGLTLEGELNKLMWNISNGRNVAGVHYYTDYIESVMLGEAITIGILREQMLCYHPNEKVTMTVPLLVPRTLPKALLGGDGTLIGENDTVSKVVIQSNGALRAA